IPVLLLTGTRSPPILGRMVRRLAALMPSAEVVAIPEAGHMGPVARPDIVADAIRAFLARRLTTGP
ncbi:MAG: alpha/beta fold hydrolase, partial [Hyphomicrobiaceae bacterium]